MIAVATFLSQIRQLVSQPDIGVWYLAMNTQMKPFKNNLPLRQAFNKAIDRNRIIRLVNGRAVPMNGILPPTINYTEPDPSCDLDYVPNISRAARVRTVLVHARSIGGSHTTMLLEGST